MKTDLKQLAVDLNQQVDDLEAWFKDQPPDEVAIVLLTLIQRVLPRIVIGHTRQHYLLQYATWVIAAMEKEGVGG